MQESKTNFSEKHMSYWRAVAMQIARDFPVEDSHDQGASEQLSLFDAVDQEQATSLVDLIERLLIQKQLGNTALVHDASASLPTSGVQTSTAMTDQWSFVSPVICYQNFLALHQCSHAEWQAARSITAKISTGVDSHQHPLNFSESMALSEEQMAAIQAATQQPLTVISGGPGTGKTTIVAEVIRQKLLSGFATDHIALTAPTGKAVQRLQESLNGRIDAQGMTFSTLHRLLSIVPADFSLASTSGKPRLSYRCVIIDEASMLDLTLCNRLLSLCHQDCHLIFLGDHNQLGSIGVGQPFLDMCHAFRSLPVMQKLTTSYRFNADSEIGKLATAVLAQDAQSFVDLANQIDAISDPSRVGTIVERAYASYKRLLDSDAPVEACLQASKQMKILTSHNHGALGCLSINESIDRWLGNATDFYHGRLLMMTQNDPVHDLYNGDMGVCFILDSIPYFITDSGCHDSVATGYRKIPILELSGLVSAYAITIHKSQGSEYDEVIITLSGGSDAMKSGPEPMLLSRSLLYTAITRAKQHVSIVADEPALGLCFSEQSKQTLLAAFITDMISGK